jgi:tetratricopeptide (TPR) repeat protein
MLRVGAFLLVMIGWTLPATAQDVASLVAAGDSVQPFLHPDLALARYQAALALDSAYYPALWRASRAVVDIAKQIEGDDGASRARRDSLYSVAWVYAVRAIRADSSDADGHFVLALSLGRLSLTRGGRDRVRFGRIIYDEAGRTLRLRPTHDGAEHILGAWHAEVKRLSAPTRFFAKLLFGGGFLGVASWDSAMVHLARSVELDPRYVYHRLELARVYLDVGRRADAQAQLEAIAGLPDGDVLDPQHRRRANELLESIRKKKGR